MNYFIKRRHFLICLFQYLIICICTVSLLVVSPCKIAAAQEYAEENTNTIEEPNDLYARSAVLMDADSGRILFEKNGYEELPMASTTKIMTCILALENAQLDEIVTVSAYASKQPAVRLGVKEGQQFILRDLLYSLMLESHNDSAVIIAEAIGGSIKGFADMMNEKAESLGCSNTYFITPNGLDEEDTSGVHHTTAAELARIMKYCIMDSPKKDLFLRITQTADHSFTDISGSTVYSCINHNSFLQMMSGALSGKTGFTNDAGYCYVGALENEGRTFIVSLLACGWPNNKGYKWADTRTLMKYGIEHYHYHNIYKTIELTDIIIENGIPDHNLPANISTVELKVNLPADVLNSGELNILMRDDEVIKTKVEVKSALKAPVSKGLKVGNVRYFLNEEEIFNYKIVTKEAKNAINLEWCTQQILKRYFLNYIDKK